MAKSRSRKESKVLKTLKKVRRPAKSDRMFREQARLYHKYLTKLARNLDKAELKKELDGYFEDE